MADKYIQLQNFKFGVDTRRSELTSQPGILVRCENAHVNHGGEIEKRKGFFKNARKFPTNTFGFDYTSVGLVTFGSDAAPNAPLPNGVSYQRLQHPQGLPMTAVSFSRNFQGSAFVVAVFSDGVSLCFYGGTLVADSWNGRVLNGRNALATLATDLATQFNALTNWQATPNVDPNGGAMNGSVIVKSPSGIKFTITDTVASANGLLGALNLSDTPTQLAGTTGQQAVAAFLVVAGTNGTYTLIAPKNQDGTGLVTLANGVLRQSSIGSTGNLITSTINANTILTGYQALTDGAGNVFVHAPLSWGASANGFTLTINVTGDVSWNNAVSTAPLTLTTSPNPSQAVGFAANGGYFWTNVVGVVRGGLAPYKFTWAEKAAGTGNGIAFTPADPGPPAYFQAGSQGSVCYFAKTLGPPVNIVVGQFILTVLDSNAATVSTTFTVALKNLAILGNPLPSPP